MVTSKQFDKMSEAHEEEREVWAVLIGRMILAFSEIEHLALISIDFAQPYLVKFGASLLFEKRVELLIQILEPHAIEVELKSTYIENLRKAQKLAETRNLISHNPVLLTFSTETDSGKLSSGGTITSVRNENKQMTLLKMRNYVQEVIACRLELNQLFSKVGYQLRFPHGQKRKTRRKATTLNNESPDA
jgi:hypothetical protein